MNIRDEIARKFWLLAAQEETKRHYESDGYEVEQGSRLGAFTADLVARRGKELVVIEFKTSAWDRNRLKEAKQLRNYVIHQLGAQFHLIWIAPPPEKHIEVMNLEEQLANSFENDFPEELELLSSHTSFEGISDISISSIFLDNGRTTVIGEGIVEVRLVYGSGSDADEGDHATDSYPFEFEIVLNPKLEVVEVNRMKVDTSSFYK